VKPPAFDYAAPTSIDEALAELAAGGEDAKLLAGGQSLIPMLNMRLVGPARLVDLNRVTGLAYVEEREGGLAIGAMTRQRSVETSDLVAARAPLLREAIGWVGHVAIRNRGTIGGSLAHADPAAELPAVAVCLDARLTVRGPRGARVLPASDFFRDALTTALEPTELLAEVWLPATPAGTGSAWLELARRHGDYALVGAAATVALAGGRVSVARLALTGVGGAPVRVAEAETLLAGVRLTPERLGEVAAVVREAVRPEGDVHATAAYRRHVAGVVAARAVRVAAARAGETIGSPGSIGRPATCGPDWTQGGLR
jgi:carbon-monoxide dehydrogenase medium subunit